MSNIYVVSTYSICPSNDGIDLNHYADSEESALSYLDYLLSEIGIRVAFDHPFKFDYESQQIEVMVYEVYDPGDKYEKSYDFRFIPKWGKNEAR